MIKAKKKKKGSRNFVNIEKRVRRHLLVEAGRLEMEATTGWKWKMGAKWSF